MLGEKHDLIHEFPEYEARIQELKQNNDRFNELNQKYDELDLTIRRSELEEEIHADEYVEELKKERLALKDELYKMIRE
ncbi:MAG: YdcH family protein [Gammaproteobacteria bacterium]